MDNAEALLYKEGSRSRITQDVKFRGMYHYIGRNPYCRVELVPCLGHSDLSSEQRYITLPPHKLWYLLLAQGGYYDKVSRPYKFCCLPNSLLNLTVP